MIQMLNAIPKEGLRVLSRYKNINSLRIREKIAFNYVNPRLLQINFHTIRHWKAMMEYYKTKDVLYVMQ